MISPKPPNKPAGAAAGNPSDKGGRGAPPKDTRFKKGHSGNPAGRPKGSKNHQAIINQQLNEKVTISVGGRERRVTVLQAAVRRLAHDGM